MLESKLSPPLRRTGSVHRPGLVNRLRVARRAAVVLVTAPPGYGKTTLVAEWARRDERPFAWYAVDASDDPTTFATYLATAVAAADPTGRVGPAVLGVPAGSPDQTLALLGRALASLDTPLVIVLDDVDLLRDADSVRLLALTIGQLPPDSQLVLVARGEPPLPLARLRARGQLVEIGMGDLRFGDREAAALLRGVGADLDRPEVEELNRRVEGWPAGLYLAALAMRGSPDGVEVARSAAADARLMVDYFRAELLSRLSEDDVRFLTRTSVLERLCGPLCDVVAETEGSTERLDRFERSNLFIVPLDRERRWYRIHGVLREVLRSELGQREPGIATSLLGRAAAWCADYGDAQLAIDYASEADDVRPLVELIMVSALPFSGELKPARVEGWLARIDDPSLLRQEPAVAAIGALTFAMIGRPAQADRWAATAPRSSSAAAWHALLRAFVSPSGARQMRTAAARAIETLPLGSPWRPPALLALGLGHAFEGDVPTADAVFEQAVDTAGALGAAPAASVALACQSLLATGSGDWARADEQAEAARELIRESHLEGYVTSAFTYAASARAALRHGDSACAHDDLRRVDELVPTLTYALPALAVFVRLELVRVYLALGDSLRASRLLDEVDEVYLRRPKLGILRDEALELRARLELEGQAAGRTSTLTAAELRLLPLLTTHLSFREIAERLYVSRNTVKTQAISVYRKLGVSSRGEAIERAAGLGLVAEAGEGKER